MRHRKAGLKLSRTSSHRNAMFRNMVTSLLKYERISTTDTKAKELRRWADNIITLAKRGDLHARRQALSIVREKDVVHKLFAEASERFGTKQGGYTRIVKLGRRPGDAAPISLIELVVAEKTKKKKKSKKKDTKAEKKVQKEETVKITQEKKQDADTEKKSEGAPAEASKTESKSMDVSTETLKKAEADKKTSRITDNKPETQKTGGDGVKEKVKKRSQETAGNKTEDTAEQ